MVKKHSADSIRRLLALIIEAPTQEKVLREAIEKLIKFNPPKRDGGTSEATAFIDGGSWGNPGPSGVGVVIEDPHGRMEIGEWIGHHDNNYAEYAALLTALVYSAASGIQKLRVYSDSELVTRQILGSYHCHSEHLKLLHDLCKIVIRSLESFDMLHVARVHNSDANRLAQDAIRGRTFHHDGALC